MINLAELEKRWLRYKIKSLLPYGIVVLLLIILLSTAFVFLPTAQQQEKASKAAATPTLKRVQKQIPAHKQTTAKPTTQEQPKKQQVAQQVLLHPSMGFLDRIANEQRVAPQQTHKTPPPKPTHVRKTIATLPPAKEEYPKQVITITRSDAADEIAQVRARFKKSNNPALSLFLAKKEYQRGNYEAAYNYALITNNLNNNIEESWIIFAKSLVKLHKRDQAIKTLKEYIKFSHSLNAKILLNAITSGKFQ